MFVQAPSMDCKHQLTMNSELEATVLHVHSGTVQNSYAMIAQGYNGSYTPGSHSVLPAARF